MLKRLHPALFASCMSGMTMTTGDIFTQSFIENNTNLNLKRAFTFTGVGVLLHGPYFYFAFKQVDKFFDNLRHTHQFSKLQTWGSTNVLKRYLVNPVLLKTFFVQLTCFPIYLFLLFSFLGVVDGVSPLSRVQEKLPTAFGMGFLYWPIVNMCVFAYVNPIQRPIVMALTATFWNMFISWLNYHHTNNILPENPSTNILPSI